MDTKAATPTKVGTCKWCEHTVWTHEPRFSVSWGQGLWHRTCAERAVELLSRHLG